jgi:hypothetical protein
MTFKGFVWLPNIPSGKSRRASDRCDMITCLAIEEEPLSKLWVSQSLTAFAPPWQITEMCYGRGRVPRGHPLYSSV